MAFDIDSFTAEMHSVGFARSSNFEVEISGNIISNISGPGTEFGLSSSLLLLINSATFPGRGVTDITYKDYGAPYKIGGQLNYVPIDIQIICSPDLREREFFMRWQDLIGGLHRNPGLNTNIRHSEFDIGYYNDYVCKKGFTLYQLDQNGFKTYAIDLIDSFPMQVAVQSYNWDSSDLQILNVTMAYRYFEERNQSKLGTQLRIGLDGIQIGGLPFDIPFSPGAIKNQARNKAKQFIGGKLKNLGGKKVAFTGLPKIF
jgi:hypothetical protein